MVVVLAIVRSVEQRVCREVLFVLPFLIHRIKVLVLVLVAVELL